MKTLIVTLTLAVLLLSGCEAFTAGAVTGAATMAELAAQVNRDAREAIAATTEEAERLNALREGMIAIGKNTVLIEPETLEAIKGLKNRESDPLTYVALASIIANAFMGGKMKKNGQS